MSSVSLPWLPRLEKACLEAVVLPLWGGVPDLPLALLEQRIQALFQGLPLRFELQAPRSVDEMSTVITEPLSLHARAAPLQGTVSCLLSLQDVWELLHLVSGSPEKAQIAARDEELCHGFALFLITTMLQSLNKSSWPPKCSWQLVQEPTEPIAMVLDGALHLKQRAFPFVLHISEPFLHSLRTQFAARPLEELNPQLAQSLDLLVDMPVGETQMTLAQLRQIHLGDVLLLDQLQIDLATGDGAFTLRVGNQDVWSCILNDGQLLADRPFPPHTENRAMSFPPEDPEEFTDFDDLGSFEDLDLDEELLPKAPPRAPFKPEPPPSRQEKPKAPSDEVISRQPHKSADQIQVQITVSLGRIVMTARELLEIRPGNILELPVNTQGPVDLLVGTDRIGRGELIQIGDQIGIRILEI